MQESHKVLDSATMVNQNDVYPISDTHTGLTKEKETVSQSVKNQKTPNKKKGIHHIADGLQDTYVKKYKKNYSKTAKPAVTTRKNEIKNERLR